MGWDESSAQWAAVKYDSSGNVMYTINQGTNNFENMKTDNTSSVKVSEKDKIALSNYPNPFNPVTRIKYKVPQDVRGEIQDVSVKVYDLTGKEIVTLVNEEKSAGEYEVEFDGSYLSSGVYFYSLNAGSYRLTQRMMIIK